ncbi:MAG: hypothetical protein KAY82_04120 [Hylemonella sp.]|nr:hypothetical protein [Hylemonella sp.]
MISLIENYPVVTAIVVAVLSWLATAWELFGLQEKFLAVCSTVMGSLGIIANFGGAQKMGALSVVGVAITLLAFLAASAWVWSRWADRQKPDSVSE